MKLEEFRRSLQGVKGKEDFRQEESSGGYITNGKSGQSLIIGGSKIGGTPGMLGVFSGMIG